jgi:hypothetical protein
MATVAEGSGVGCGYASCFFIHYPHSNPHTSQMGRVWVENNCPLKKWAGWVWGGYKKFIEYVYNLVQN